LFFLRRESLSTRSLAVWSANNWV